MKGKHINNIIEFQKKKMSCFAQNDECKSEKAKICDIKGKCQRFTVLKKESAREAQFQEVQC
ncbi:MAG: hypothetical protein PHX21_13055 [bacterium]|nr:hypothetical protein [bacterium]